MKKIILDISKNRNNSKGLFFILIFRFCSFWATRKWIFPLNIIFNLIFILPYKIVIQWIFSIDIPSNTKIGRGFQLKHGQGIVINSGTIIGENVKIRHNVTIGKATKSGGCPVIEDNVDIGANSVIIGNIVIGKSSKIGALTLVNKSIPENAIVVGNPFRLIR